MVHGTCFTNKTFWSIIEAFRSSALFVAKRAIKKLGDLDAFLGFLAVLILQKTGYPLKTTRAQNCG